MMSKTNQLNRSQLVPIGTRLKQSRLGIGRLMRSCLTALLLLFVVQGARATAYGPEFCNFNKTVSITGNLYYSFDVMFFDYGGDNFEWSGDKTVLKIGGNEICKIKDLLSGYYDFGSNNEKTADNFLKSYGGKHVVTRDYNINNVTNVYVTVRNPYHKSGCKSYYFTIDVAFERNFTSKKWDIQWYGYWHYNDGSGKTVNQTIFTANTPTVTTPSINGNNFSRSGNKKIKFSYPSVTTYSGWSNQTIMYTSDCSEKWMNPSGNSYATLTESGEFGVSSNYEPVTIYPRFEFYKNDATTSGSGKTNVSRFDRDYGAITIPGQPRPKNIQVSASNTYSKEVTITWEREAYNSSSATDGKWIIFRKVMGNASSQIKLGEVPNGTYTYTDNKHDLEYNTTYTYTVCYQPKNWSIGSEADAEGLSGYVRETLTRDFAFSNLKTEEKDGKIIFSWSHNQIQDASNSKTYNIYVQRSDDNGSTWKDLQTIKVTSTSTTGGSYTDANVATHKPYQYRLKTNVQDNDVISTVKTATLTSGSYLTGFSASRGNYNTSVKLSWTVHQVGTEPAYFTLQRRPLGSTNESLWADIYTTSGTNTNYSYDDNTAQPGSFNEYRLKIFDMYNGTRYEGTAKETDGFCLTTGVVSGRITYGSGTAVEGVKITLGATNADGDSVRSNRSLYFDGTVNAETGGSGITCATDANDTKNMFGGDFTIQMWVKPDSTKMTSTSENYELFDLPGTVGLFVCKSSPSGYFLRYMINNTIGYFDKKIDADKWTHITLAYSKSAKKLTLYTTQDCSSFKDKVEKTGVTIQDKKLDAATSFGFGNWSNLQGPTPYAGYMDELRIFNRCLSDAEILKNCNHTLNGSEEGLQAYYPLDEGMTTQTVAYDFSKQNGISNGHHMFTGTAARSEQNIVPSGNQLSLMTYTDKDGNYMLRGIPFSGEGTNYTITPTLGIHKFNPGNESRFFNLNSLSYSAVNFEDVSSFPVSGKVLFDGTTIPVQEAMIYVDGNLAVKDGEAVMTDANGEFKVDVPIGDHFIQVKKNGHTFENDGYYPGKVNDAVQYFTFEGEKTGLTFYDNTRVTVAGRVAGGDIEYEKPLGLGQGVANIGQAVLTLTYANSSKYYINAKETKKGTSVSYSQSTTQRNFDATTPNVNSTTYVEGGKNKITIKTDPVTGEWAAELLPLKYTVESISIPKNTSLSISEKPEIDATNPQREYTDTLAGSDEEFKYVASCKIRYKAKNTIDLIENEDGSYGEKSIKVTGLDGNTAEVPLYTVSGKKVNYKFGYPVYQEMGSYTYLLHAYERYVNKDSGKEVEDIVPLANKTVKIENQYATGVSVNLENGDVVEGNEKEFELDSLGYLTYTFTAGLPNIQSPYTRGLSIAYDDNGTMVNWEGNSTFKVIVLGAISTGNNFTTQAPDQVLMVLRDPPGTGSSVTYSKGTTHTEEGTLNVTAKLGGKMEAFVNAAMNIKTANGVGVAVITETELSGQTGGSFEASTSIGTSNSWSHTTTLTEDITTSSASDFVGAPGDLFIGASKNTIFGACHIVKVKKNEKTSTTTNPVYELVMEDGFSTGDQFGTTFMYSQNYIEGVLIPNYEMLRDSLLLVVADPSSVAHPAAGEDPLYVTTLSKDDPKFGTNNNDKTVWGANAKDMAKGTDANGIFRGPSYWIILPADWKTSGKVYQDMVQFYNEQVKGWTRQLARNEEAKVLAITNRDDYLIDNYSFDAGASLTRTTEEKDNDSHSFEFTEETQCLFSDGAKMDQDGNGFEMKYEIYSNQNAVTTYVNSDEKTTGFSFTLAEDGDDDYLSVDVFDAPDNFGPIFYTRGGATCCPYEDEVVTQYYEPGTVISEKTVQIEKPEIEANTQIITGIPAGGKGVFQVYIRNNSDTSEDGMYNINVVPASNPDGLVVKMDGLNITTGRAIMVKAGEPMLKTFTVEQSNPDVLSYPDIQIRISSQCQPDNTGVFPEIADTTTVSVYFQPTCSDVNLATTHTLVNTDTETAQTLTISGYNYSMQSLEGIILQYKGKNDADFVNLQKYVKDKKLIASDPNLKELPALTGTNKLQFVIDLRKEDFSDQTYVFRAITVCNQGGVEVNNESEEIEIVRDMTRPMLIATPTPASGILTNGADMTITFNEDIQNGILYKLTNFDVLGVLNETEVAHEVALNLTGENAAKTQNTIDLSSKSFSTSMWLNYTSNGTLLQHGTSTNNFTVAIENGKLAVSVAGQKVTSTKSLPTGKWIYLNVSYDANNKTIDADYVQDASEVSLLRNADVPAYEGNGPVSLGGNNLNAKVQELAIWNSARSLAKVQADMYTTKSQYTSGLLGYWQFNEGHGDVATDKARSRNITLPSQNAWWIAGDNYALTLDGTKAAAANIGSLNTTESEDYLVETWFKADKKQNGVASVLSTQVMDLRLNAKGIMELALKGSTNEVMDTDLRDGQWHHVAVNVLKGSNGSAIIYVDGVQRKQISASDMPALYGEKLMLGSHRTSVDGKGLYTYDQMLKGAIDEVRIWKARRSADVIKNNMYNRVKADEAGLVGYYPMERLGLDQYNQVVTTADMTDATKKNAGALTFYTAGAAATTGTTSSANTAALTMAPSMTNVEFNFVASERQITVNLTEQPYKLEGCNIYITAKNVKDIHGNAANPITWGVYVQQNNLKWQENNVTVTKAGAEEQTFTATIENRSSESESWSLTDMPEWLSANIDGGILTPLASQDITFTVAAGLPIGSYETIVNLTGSQSINTPLYVNVSSEGDAPNWVATTGEHSMTVVGQLKIDNALSNDPKDMVAAFRGTECVGVAQPKYLSRYDTYMIMMSIYGNEDADLTYKAYDASTGTIYPSVSLSDDAAYTFTADKAVGTFKAPVIFTPKNEIEQDLSMNKAGWKWFSLYAKPANTNPSVIFKDAKDAIFTLTDGVSSIINWVGNMDMSRYTTMYKLNATAPFKESFVGTPTNPDEIDITLTKNSWSWIGYPAQASNSVTAAFASAEPEEGDIVKNQSAFAIYTDGDWVGNLTAMVPGEGYLYKSEAATNKTFNYPKPAVSARKNMARRAAQQSGLNIHQYEDNMTMIATVMNGDEIIQNAEVSVYAGTDLRGQSTNAVKDDKHFIVIDGKKGQADMLTFVVKCAEGEFFLIQTEQFEANANKGTMAAPYVLQLDEATSIANALKDMNIKSVVLYDASGRQVSNADKAYTKNDLKSMPAGVYFQQVFFDNGQSRVMKMTR